MSRRATPEVQIVKFFETAELPASVSVFNIVKHKVAARLADESHTDLNAVAKPRRKRQAKKAKAEGESETSTS